MTKVSLIIPSFEVGGTESSFIRKANFLKNTEFIPELAYLTITLGLLVLGKIITLI